MRKLNWWGKIALSVATAALLASVPTFAQSTQTAATKTSATTKTTKKAVKPPAHKATGSAVHHSSRPQSSKTRSATSRKGSRRGKNSKTSWRRSQQKVDPDRTRQIQEALIREHYLNGAPSGKWDASTEDALRRMQADNGWQNKTVPDSRALIKLGLGPNHDHLLNPESAMTTVPDAPRSTGVPATPSIPATPASTGQSQQ